MLIDLMIILVIGGYLIAAALILHTGNMLSGLLFKVIPFFSGLYLGYYALNTGGII